MLTLIVVANVALFFALPASLRKMIGTHFSGRLAVWKKRLKQFAADDSENAHGPSSPRFNALFVETALCREIHFQCERCSGGYEHEIEGFGGRVSHTCPNGWDYVRERKLWDR